MVTASFFAADLDAARRWYADLLGAEPYYEVPGAYLEWRVGDGQDELGLIHSRYAPHDVSRPGGAILYWQVDDARAGHARLLAAGATAHEPPTERGAPGSGFVTACVVDPFGNLLGIMENPHHAALRRSRGASRDAAPS